MSGRNSPSNSFGNLTHGQKN